MWEKKTGHIYFIMGTAGAGKWTLIKNLEKQSDLWIEFLKSYVSRDMREWEIDGDVYHFISQKEFEIMIEADEFLEYEIVHKIAYYWTKMSDAIDNWINIGKTVMKEVDIEGLKNILANHPQLRSSITSIFLRLSPEMMVERIKKRWATISAEELHNRSESLVLENKWAKKYCDYIIDTSEKTPEEVLEEAMEIISKK